MPAKIHLIAALDHETRGIGLKGKLPWPRLPEDMKRFQSLTSRGGMAEANGLLHRSSQGVVIMGKGTYLSLGRSLRGRTNVVVSGKRDIELDNEACFVRDCEEAHTFPSYAGVSEAWIIGGQSLYEFFLPKADKLYLTLVTGPVFGADRYFPPYEGSFREVRRGATYREGEFEYVSTIWVPK